jgi:ABC-type transport system involved in cytochrome bd biosynthesis fused ATPase/permease subunit
MGLVAILIILMSEWNAGKELNLDISISILAMVYFVFFSVNIITYFALTNVQSFLAILFRLSEIIGMEEQQTQRITNGPEVLISIQNASFSWGFRVKDVQKDSKSKGKVKVQIDDQPIISGINLELGSSDLLVVVGQVGCGKTTLLHSIMEETRINQGMANISGTVAYVEQEPFIYSDTIK